MFLKNTNMFINKSKGNSLSIITQGIDFTGEVNTEGDIHLDGNMKGIIKANEVVIGPNGSFEGEIIWDKDKPDGTFQKLLDVSKLRELGWNAKINLSEGLKKTYADYKKEIKNNTLRLKWY